MHIPDGYLIFPICLFFYFLMIPLWLKSIKTTITKLGSKYLPVLAIGIAFSLTIMMLNFNIMGNTPGHAIGTGVLSLIFGPWISALIITVALLIQALFFGEGGLSTFAVNSCIIAYSSSFIMYYLYKFLSHNIKKYSVKILMTGLSAHLALSSSALLTGIILGIQTIFFRMGTALPMYFPYSIKIAISVIIFEHLLIFSWVEAALTIIVIGFFFKDNNLDLKDWSRQFRTL